MSGGFVGGAQDDSASAWERRSRERGARDDARDDDAVASNGHIARWTLRSLRGCGLSAMETRSGE